MLLVQILTCQGINREQMIKRTYVTLFISFPLLSILGVFHRSRVLCPPFLSRWFLNITIYLEKFKTKNNFCECQNNLYVKKLSGLFCLKNLFRILNEQVCIKYSPFTTQSSLAKQSPGNRYL